jgi:transposase
MSDLIWLSEAQMRRVEPHFPLFHGVPWVDDRGSSAVHLCDQEWPAMGRCTCGVWPPKTIYNRFIRWSRLGVFNKIFAALSAKGGKPDQLMIDAAHLKAHRMATSSKKDVPRRIRRTKGGLNSKLHVACGKGRPLIMLLSERQKSDYKGAVLVLDALRRAKAEVTTPTGSVLQSATSPPASRQSPTERFRSSTMPPSTASATRSRICSAGSRAGAASTPATIATRTPLCQPSASSPPLSAGSINEA